MRNHGLAVYATFIFGYDNDNKDSFEDTLRFALRHKFFFCAFNHLVPFPGTPLFERLYKEKKLLYRKWWLHSKYSFGHVALDSALLTSNDLTQLCFDYRKKFYSLHSIFKRALDLKANCRNFKMLILYISLNALAKKEVIKRHGWPLGINHE